MKQLVSYFFPIRVKTYDSPINGKLELNLVNGKIVLDTTCSNYSYGSLERILYAGLREIEFDDNIRKILLLGLGGGSVIQTIRQTFQSDALIVAIDVDPQIIQIALNDFNIKRFKNVKIIQADASAYIENSNDIFDLIIVDIFIGNSIPESFTQSQFISQLTKHVKLKGKIIYNTIRSTIKSEIFNQIQNEFLKRNFKVKAIERVEWTNDIIIAENRS
ncbi:fused MFS/spermidine synthase [Rhodoflexus sp.]